MAKINKSSNRPGPGGGRSGGGAGNYFKKSTPAKKVEKKVTKPDSPFLKFVEPKRKNTANIEQTLKRLRAEKSSPKVTNLADFKNKKLKRGK